MEIDHAEFIRRFGSLIIDISGHHRNPLFFVDHINEELLSFGILENVINGQKSIFRSLCRYNIVSHKKNIDVNTYCENLINRLKKRISTAYSLKTFIKYTKLCYIYKYNL